MKMKLVFLLPNPSSFSIAAEPKTNKRKRIKQNRLFFFLDPFFSLFTFMCNLAQLFAVVYVHPFIRWSFLLIRPIQSYQSGSNHGVNYIVRHFLYSIQKLVYMLIARTRRCDQGGLVSFSSIFLNIVNREQVYLTKSV